MTDIQTERRRILTCLQDLQRHNPKINLTSEYVATEVAAHLGNNRAVVLQENTRKLVEAAREAMKDESNLWHGVGCTGTLKNDRSKCDCYIARLKSALAPFNH